MADSNRPARTILCALFLGLSAAMAHAQSVVLPPAAEPRLPGRPPPVPEADLDISIPAQPRTTEPRAVDELRFPIVQITIEGATIYSQAELSAFTAPLRPERKARAPSTRPR